MFREKETEIGEEKYHIDKPTCRAGGNQRVSDCHYEIRLRSSPLSLGMFRTGRRHSSRGLCQTGGDTLFPQGNMI